MFLFLLQVMQFRYIAHRPYSSRKFGNFCTHNCTVYVRSPHRLANRGYRRVNSIPENLFGNEICLNTLRTPSPFFNEKFLGIVLNKSVWVVE